MWSGQFVFLPLFSILPMPILGSLICISSQVKLKTNGGVKLRIRSPKHSRGCYNCKFVSLSAVRCAFVLQFVSHCLHMFEWRNPERQRKRGISPSSSIWIGNTQFLLVQVQVSRGIPLSSGIILLSNSSVQTIFLDSVVVMNAQPRRNNEIDL